MFSEATFHAVVIYRDGARPCLKLKTSCKFANPKNGKGVGKGGGGV